MSATRKMVKVKKEKPVKVLAKPDPQKLQQLEEMEAKIHEGIISYYQTGELLRQIQEDKLYTLRGYKSFSAYCRETFHFGRSYGYRLIAYSSVRNILAEENDKIPERVLRALTKLVKSGSADDDAIKACWQEAKSKAGDQMPNYQLVEDIVAKRRREEFCQNKNVSRGQFYLASIKEVVSESNVAKDLIDKAQTYHSLSNAITEARKRRNVPFKKAEVDALRKKLRELRDADIDKLFQ